MAQAYLMEEGESWEEREDDYTMKIEFTLSKHEKGWEDGKE